MKPRQVRDGVWLMGAVDWDRRLFDALVPIPDGTSYNSYLVAGTYKTALIDTVDPMYTDELMRQLEGVDRLDYIVANHAEQDHSGSIPDVLRRYPGAKVVCTPKCRAMLIDLVHVPEEQLTTVDDGDTLDLGGLTLEFIHAPWVHWPETMLTYLKEQKILFTCDFLGSHLATSHVYSTGDPRNDESMKRYFAEIMMPFSANIVKNLDKISGLEIQIVAPSHGPLHDDPLRVIDMYRNWTSGPLSNTVLLPYVSMHGSTAAMVHALVEALVSREVQVRQYELTASDVGRVAMGLVDAATIVIGTPTVLAGPHPAAAYVAILANALRPRTKFISVVNSYSWGGKAVEQIAALTGNLKAELLEPVVCKGLPRESDFQAIERLADTIASKHREAGLI